ncbi:RluA family pseudouridine synthase [Candidatus Peregrinibacteria bacterium]|nr:RluA family pseudouridine synthase [Candidatus Peregrinibacteria bacterium]
MNKKKLPPVLYEDDFLIAVNKPARIATVPGGGISNEESVAGLMQKQFQGKACHPYVLHRLDIETSGVLLLGKHEQHRKILEEIFRHPSTRKKYIALLKGIPFGKLVTKPLPSRSSGELVPAETHYKVLQIFHTGGPKLALVEAEIKTGRKHQIRRHFAGVGHPVVLDALYGDQRFNRKFRIIFRLGRLFLHAGSIEFRHPFLKKMLRIEAPLPMDLQSVLKKLRS